MSLKKVQIYKISLNINYYYVFLITAWKQQLEILNEIR